MGERSRPGKRVDESGNAVPTRRDRVSPFDASPDFKFIRFADIALVLLVYCRYLLPLLTVCI